MRVGVRALTIIALRLVLAYGGAGIACAEQDSQTHMVVIENMAFTPSTLRIHAGDRVTFKNRDLVPHTATAKGKPPVAFDSGAIKPGETWTVTPRPGEEPTRYACTFHPTM